MRDYIKKTSEIGKTKLENTPLCLHSIFITLIRSIFSNYKIVLKETLLAKAKIAKPNTKKCQKYRFFYFPL